MEADELRCLGEVAGLEQVEDAQMLQRLADQTAAVDRLAVLRQPAAGTLGSTQARNSIRGMGTRNLDLSLTRLIRIRGTQALEVRIDAFNAFNWFQWAQPATALNNTATFGQITSVINGSPRTMQLGIKYQF